MNLSRRLLGYRGAAAGAVLLAFLVAPAALRTQQETKEWIFVSHGLGSAQSGISVSRLDPLAPIIPPISSPLSGVMNFPAGDFVLDMGAYPTATQPQHILLASTGVGNMGYVRRISPAFTGGALSQCQVGGRIRGACLVNRPYIKPHYFVTHDWPNGTTSNSAISFVSIDGDQVLDQGVMGAFFHSWGRGAQFTYWDGNTPGDPTDDKFRWWWTDIYRIGLTEDRLLMLELGYSDILQTDGLDPFNPPSSAQIGPPFRSDVFITQMNMMPPARFRTVLTMSGNDDSYSDLDVWKHPGSANNNTLIGNDYLLCCHTEQIPGPAWRTDFFGFNASNFDLIGTTSSPNLLKSLSNPTNVSNTDPSLPGFTNSIRGGQQLSPASQPVPPAFHQMKVIGNWLFWTNGFTLTSSGGTQLQYLYLTTGTSSTGMLTTPFSPGSAPMTIPNSDAVDGLVGSFSKSHVYVGGDESSNTVYRYPVQTLSANLMFTGLTGQNPPLIPNGVQSFAVFSGEELSMMNPPVRGYPILAGLSFQMTSDLINTFDGYDPHQTGRAYNGCSAGGVTAATLFGVGALLVLLGCSRWLFRR